MQFGSKGTVYIATGITAIGFVVIFLGWNGAAEKDFVSGQIPYVISGGIAGEQWNAAYQWSSRHLSVAASTQQATAGYRTLASLDAGHAPTRAVSQVSASTTLAGGGLSVGHRQAHSSERV